MSTEFGVCEVPGVHQSWEEPLPTKRSWQAARSIGITHVRMNYRTAKLRYFDPAFRLTHDGGMHITANMCVDDLETAHPDVIEGEAHDLVAHYGSDLESVSFENEPGGKDGMSPRALNLDISQGGRFDWISIVYGPLFLAFVAGARRAKPDIIIDAFDADSTDVQERCMALVEDDRGAFRWTAHNYADAAGDSSKGDPAGQDYSSMAGMNGKPGFLSVFESDPLRRGWYIAEISKATGPFGGIATSSDMDVMLRYTKYMLSKFKPQKIDFLTAKYFFTRVEVQPWLNPPPTFSTWTMDEPVPSAQGLLIAAEFAKVNKPVSAIVPGRRPGKGER